MTDDAGSTANGPVAFQRPLHPDDYRRSGEGVALFISAGAIILLAVVTQLWIIALILLVVAAVVVRMQQKSILGNSVRTGRRQFQDVFQQCISAARRLGMHAPDVFIRQDPQMNAFALRVGGRGTVVLQTGLIDALTFDERLFVIGHEFGHIACGHTRMMLIRGIPDAGVGIPLVTPVLGWSFSFWQRKAEYTADRAGLLACRNVDAAIGALVKLAVGPRLAAEIDLQELLHQRTEADADVSGRLAETFGSHPFLLKRVEAIREYGSSKAFKRLVEDTGAPAPDAHDVRT